MPHRHVDIILCALGKGHGVPRACWGAVAGHVVKHLHLQFTMREKDDHGQPFVPTRKRLLFVLSVAHSSAEHEAGRGLSV